MYTTEDIENLAEFQYLAASQEVLFGKDADKFEGKFTEWKDLPDFCKQIFRVTAKIAFDFIKYRE